MSIRTVIRKNVPKLRVGPLFGQDGRPAVGADVSRCDIRVTVPGLLAQKDTYVWDTSQCLIDNANHNGEDLLIDGLAAAKKIVYIGWDLAAYPAGMAISAASFKIKWQNTGLADGNIDARHIANADEGWNESGITCSSRPVPGAVFQTFAWSLGAVEQTVTLNATAVSRIQARCGVGYYTIVLTPPDANALSRIIEAADQGVDNSLGPRLTFVGTKSLAV